MTAILAHSSEEQKCMQALRKMKQRLYDPQAAAQAQRLANAASNSFDTQTYANYITAHPVFSKLHLISEDNE